MPHSPTRHRVALGLALTGLAVSTYTLVVHQRLAADTGYTSFCNLGGVVNCDLVIGSRYGVILGVPVAAWGAAGFAVGAALALPGAVGAAAGLADLLLLGLASASLGFALVLLGVSVFVLHHLCLLCLTLDVVILAWFAAVAPFASRFATGPQAGGWWRRRAAARGVVSAGLVLAVAGGTWATVRTPAPVTSVDDVRARDPKFYRWYTSQPEQPIANLSAPDCPRQGPTDAAIAIVEFSDFQCPFCEQAFRDLREIRRANPDVSLTFRHFPLDATCNSHVVRSLHPDACLAACAAECANRQGRFWEYHDALFENHDSLERESLFRYARETRLDLAAFRTCLDDPTTRARVGADIAAARQVGVESTPTLFINGRTLSGALERPYYDYALVIERHRHAHAAGGAS
jgi:protein-disulfide isomerase/uncharacterized membrane protein